MVLFWFSGLIHQCSEVKPSGSSGSRRALRSGPTDLDGCLCPLRGPTSIGPVEASKGNGSGCAFGARLRSRLLLACLWRLAERFRETLLRALLPLDGWSAPRADAEPPVSVSRLPLAARTGGAYPTVSVSRLPPGATSPAWRHATSPRMAVRTRRAPAFSHWQAIFHADLALASSSQW